MMFQAGKCVVLRRGAFFILQIVAPGVSGIIYNTKLSIKTSFFYQVDTFLPVLLIIS